MPKISFHHHSAPAIKVKDRTAWAHDPRTSEMIEALGKGEANAIYEGVKEDFWQDVAPDIAREHGYNGDVWSEGRMGGWLQLGDALYWPEYITDRDTLEIPMADATADEDTREEYTRMIAERDRFLRFASAIDGAVKAAGETYVQRLQEAFAELEERRESCLIRSNN